MRLNTELSDDVIITFTMTGAADTTMSIPGAVDVNGDGRTWQVTYTNSINNTPGAVMWDTGAVATVSTADNIVAGDGRTASIAYSAYSEDPAYHGIEAFQPVDPTGVTIQDNDVPGVIARVVDSTVVRMAPTRHSSSSN